MSNKSRNVSQETTMANIAATTLAQYCPDLESWPQRWQYDEDDLPMGRDIVECLRPFLLDLLSRELTPKTLRRHRDNLWLLGGELIRRRYEDTRLKKLPAQEAIAELIEPDGGPLIWPRISQTDQDSLDATCRRLYRFLEAREKPAAKG
jgi:hypothetical protein